MAISDRDILSAPGTYLERYPEDAALLSEPVLLLSQGGDFASRRSFPMHVTAGVLLVCGAEVSLSSTARTGSSCSLENWRPPGSGRCHTGRRGGARTGGGERY